MFNKGCANMDLAVFFEAKGKSGKAKGNYSSEKIGKTVTGWQISYMMKTE
ncbi:MAG: hypothetical protein NVSMB24_30110 [Mucilaginibacter sp.]